MGAIIGYITNAVAVKMLFRPLNEIRIWGIRLPFTPGILPRQRQVLAQSIGAMVERELLTAEILQARLDSPEVREGLRLILEEYTEEFFKLPPEKWLGGIQDYIITGAEVMYPRAAEALNRFLRKRETKENIEAQFRILLSRSILKMTVVQRLFVSLGQYDYTLEEKIPEIVEDLLDQAEALFSSPEGKKKIIENLEEELRSFPKKHPEFSLGRILASGESWTGESLKNRLDSFLTDHIIDTARLQAATLLSTINIKKLVSDRINSLDMLRVERIILDVLAGQLRWINVFGGILGSLIGFSQVILSTLVRA